jgi:hypothetical protein
MTEKIIFDKYQNILKYHAIKISSAKEGARIVFQ